MLLETALSTFPKRRRTTANHVTWLTLTTIVKRDDQLIDTLCAHIGADFHMAAIIETTIQTALNAAPPLSHAVVRQKNHSVLTDALNDVVANLASDGGTAQALLTAADRACEIFAVNRVSIFLRGSSSMAFKGVAARTPGDSSLVHRMRCGPSTDRMSQQLIDQCTPVLVRDPIRDGRPARSTMLQLNVKEVLGVPMVSHNKLTGLMFLDQVGSYRRFTQADTEIASHFANMLAAVVPAARRLDDLLTQVHGLQAQAERSDSLHAATRHISAMLISGATPQQIVDTTSELTGHACVFTDTRHRVLATDAVHPAEPATLADLRSVLAEPRPRGAATQLRVGRSTVLACPVTTENAIRGHLTLIPHRRRLRDDDTRLIGFAATALTAELRVAAARYDCAADQRRQFAQALLEGRIDVETEQLAAHLDVQLARTRLVGVVEKRAPSPVQPNSGDLVESFEAQFGPGTVLATAVPGSDGHRAIAVIIDASNIELERGQPAELHRLAAEALRRADPEVLLATFGAVSHNEATVADSFSSAQRVMHVLRTLCPPEVTCLTLDDLGFSAPLLYGIDRPGALLHVRRVFGTNELDYACNEPLDTVAAYFANGRSIRETSRRLVVHENTVRYRLKKFHATAGLDVLADAADQLTCQLALLIHRLISGRLEASKTPIQEIP